MTGSRGSSNGRNSSERTLQNIENSPKSFLIRLLIPPTGPLGGSNRATSGGNGRDSPRTRPRIPGGGAPRVRPGEGHTVTPPRTPGGGDAALPRTPLGSRRACSIGAGTKRLSGSILCARPEEAVLVSFGRSHCHGGIWLEKLCRMVPSRGLETVCGPRHGPCSTLVRYSWSVTPLRATHQPTGVTPVTMLHEITY